MKNAKRYLLAMGAILLTQAYQPLTLPAIVVCGLILTALSLCFIEFWEFRALLEKDRRLITEINEKVEGIRERLSTIESAIALARTRPGRA